MKSIVIIIDYFGTFPEWLPLYLESCRFNPTINWLIHTDCAIDFEYPPNVKFVNITWDNYRLYVSKKLDIAFYPFSTYKICDIKPALGHIWEDEISQYDFWGFGDIDLVYGDIRSFYTDDILEKYRVLSINKEYLSGPLCILRNDPSTVRAYTILDGWKEGFEDQRHFGIDEYDFRRVFYKTEGVFVDEVYSKNQFATPLEKQLWKNYGDMQDILHDDTWYWKNGKITSEKNGSREFICLHFMNYLKGTWLDSSYGDVAPWKSLKKINRVTDIQKGIMISLQGMTDI